MHWKEDILQGNIRENKGRKTSTEDTTCVDSALGLGLDPHGAAFGPPVFTQELERSKPWACNRKQLGKERNITCCMPYSSQNSVLTSNQSGYTANTSSLTTVGAAWILRCLSRHWVQRIILYLMYIQHINPVHSSGLACPIWNAWHSKTLLLLKNTTCPLLSLNPFPWSQVRSTLWQRKIGAQMGGCSEVSSTFRAAQSS